MKRETYIQTKIDYHFPFDWEGYEKIRLRAKEILEKEIFHDLDYLSVTDKILLWLKLKGLTIREIGEILGLSDWKINEKEYMCFSKIHRNE